MDKSFYWFLWSKFIQFVILFIWCANSVNSYCDSYPENYSERTLHHKLKDDQQKKVIQNQILNLFGLKERPNLTSERNKRRSNSNYLNAIYNQYNVLKDVNLSPSDLNRTKESQMNLPNLQAIEDSDVIISFDSQTTASSNASPETSQVFRFNISRAYAYDKVIRSELVFYQSRLNLATNSSAERASAPLGTNLTAPSDSSSDSPSDSSNDSSSNFTATDPAANRTSRDSAAHLPTRSESTSQDVRFSIQVNVKSLLHNVTLNYTLTKSISNEDSWVKMDFTNIFKELLYDRQKEFNLEISSFLVTDRQQVVRSWSVFVDEASKPLVVSYFKLNVNLHEQNRIKRDLVNSQASSSETKFTNHRRLLKRTSQRRTCQLNSFFISFKELGWQDWIIAPEGYSSFFCSGQCLFPLKESTNATNHAIIQSLMQVLNPQNYPKPCCAAIKFSSVDLLLVTEDQAVMWKRYKKMVPRACGCV